MFKRIDLCSDLSAAQTCLFTFSQISFPSSSIAFLLFLFLFLSSFSTYFLSLLTSFFPSLPLVSFLFPLLSPFVYVFSFCPPFLPDILLCFFVSFSISSFHVKFPSIFFPFFPNLIFSFLLSLPSVLALTHFYFLTSLFVSFCVLVPFLEGENDSSSLNVMTICRFPVCVLCENIYSSVVCVADVNKASVD